MNGVPNLRCFSFWFLGGRYYTEQNCTVLARLSLFLPPSSLPFPFPFPFFHPYLKKLENSKTRITYPPPFPSPLEKQIQTRYSLQRL